MARLFHTSDSTEQLVFSVDVSNNLSLLEAKDRVCVAGPLIEIEATLMKHANRVCIMRVLFSYTFLKPFFNQSTNPSLRLLSQDLLHIKISH